MNGEERRMTYRVTSEWLGLKRQQPFPSIDFLHPKSFSVDWNQCVLIRLLDGSQLPQEEGLEFEFVGNSFRKDAPELKAGMCVNSIPEKSLLSLSMALLPKLFERQAAVIHSGVRPWRSSGTIHFRAIAVPFGDSSGELKYGLGAFSHKLSAETVLPQDSKSEFLEYRDGGWSPFSELPDPQLVQVA